MSDNEVTEESTKKSKKEAHTKEETATSEPKMFAVVRTGGKQYRVSPGMRISVEKLNIEAGSAITFPEVLMIGREGGQDVQIASGDQTSVKATVAGKVVRHTLDKKVLIFKKRRKGGYTKKQGHRQEKSEVIIETVAL